MLAMVAGGMDFESAEKAAAADRDGEDVEFRGGGTRSKNRARSDRSFCVPCCPSRTTCCGLSAVLGLFFIIGGLLVVFHFNDVIDAVIKSKVPLQEHSSVTATWMRPPIRPLMRVYFFNMTNPEGFLKRREKPKLREIGPYVYEQSWEKVGVSWLDDGEEVEYRQKKLFHFRRDLSVGPERDVLTLPNVPLISALNSMKYKGDLVRLALNSMLQLLHQEPFMKVSVRKVMWGFDNPLVKLGNDILPEEKKLPTDKFGFFVGKNDTPLGLIRAMTGLYDVRKVGKIVSFDGKTHMGKWKTEECDKIRGTDGSVFHPGITKHDTLWVYNKDLCRNLPLVFQTEVITSDGLPGYRFVPPDDVFAAPSDGPGNACYCAAGDGCPGLPSGVFNVSLCQFDAPIILSWPHFFKGDPSLLDAVEGLNPVAEKHQFFLDIMPKLGTTLRAQARSQINVAFSPAGNLSVAEGFRDVIVPVLWMSDGVEEIDDEDTIALLRRAIFGPETARSVIYPSFFVVGSVILVVSLGLVVRSKWSKVRRNSSDFDVSPGSKGRKKDNKAARKDLQIKSFRNGAFKASAPATNGDAKA